MGPSVVRVPHLVQNRVILSFAAVTENPFFMLDNTQSFNGIQRRWKTWLAKKMPITTVFMQWRKYHFRFWHEEVISSFRKSLQETLYISCSGNNGSIFTLFYVIVCNAFLLEFFFFKKKELLISLMQQSLTCTIPIHMQSSK